MPIAALLIDLFTFLLYLFQTSNQSKGIFMIGILFQSIFTVLLLFFVIKYQGKKYAKIQTTIFMHTISIRYAIIIFSFFASLIMLFLYVLNILDINDLLFTSQA